MVTKKVLLCVALVSLAVLLAGCAETTPPESTPTETATATGTAGGQQSSVAFSFVGVEDVSPAHLEGWALFGEEKISTGKFMIDADGTIMSPEGESLNVFIVDGDLTTADTIVVTIEPEGDTDAEPSGIVLLSGSVEGTSADLTFPVDLSEVNGTYILATPTNGGDTDEASGIWFLQLPEPPGVGLNLPTLPDGWIYEGWVVNSGVPLTSGRFVSADGADLFNGFSSTEPSPPFPGEDYLVNPPEGVTFPIDLADGDSQAVISIEPDQDGVDPTGDAPFAIKPLIADIPAGADDHVNYDMDQNLETVPSGSAQMVLLL